MRFSGYYIIAFFGLMIGSYGWLQPGTSLCFVGTQQAMSQIQFSHRYWHRNQLLYAGIESVDVVPHPTRPGEQTLRIRGQSMELVYGFVDRSWVDDIDQFKQQVEEVVQQKRRLTCRFRNSVWLITTGLVLLLTALGMFIRSLLNRPN
jgi:hypothetical protein